MTVTKTFPDLSNVPWPTSDPRVATPETSAAPGSTPVTPAVVDPARQLGEHVSAADAALHQTTGPLRDTRDEWVEGVRASVRDNPLATVAAAVALGALIARIAR